MKTLTTLALFVALIGSIQTVKAESYTFSLTNTTEDKMVKLLVSEDGKQWSYFNIGDGIAPGESAQLEWDESTNNQGCEQKVKAVYDDGSESEVAEFDFCEEDLELEF